MKLVTKLFGEIEISEEKIITFGNGIIGFSDLKKFTLVYDEENQGAAISWLQSLDEPAFAIPVMNPLLIKESYDPFIDDELLKPLGEITPENSYVLVTVTVPKEIKELSVNLKAPIVINVDEKKGSQIIVEDNFPVKYLIYDILESQKKEGGK